MAITKAELVKKLLQTIIELEKEDAIQLVDNFFEEICTALEQGREVKLTGFGSFNLRNKNERPGRNPRTGETIPVTARRVVTFHPSAKLKAKLVNNKPAKS